MKARIEIDTSNAAFEDNASELFAVAERAVFAILRMEESSALDAESVLFDSNGNRCGFARVEFTESEWEAETMSEKLARIPRGNHKLSAPLAESLHISNVDLRLLEAQRIALATIPREAISSEQNEAIDGIQSMLDFWSDERARKLEAPERIDTAPLSESLASLKRTMKRAKGER